MRFLIAAVAAAGLSIPSVHAAYDGAGSGTNDCSSYTDLYAASSADQRDDLMLGVGQWAMGYMTGLNIRVDEVERHDLAGFQPSTIGADILAVCEAVPNATIMEVVTAMYLEAPMYSVGV